MPFDLRWSKEQYTGRLCISAPPGEHDGSICAAALTRAVATIRCDTRCYFDAMGQIPGELDVPHSARGWLAAVTARRGKPVDRNSVHLAPSAGRRRRRAVTAPTSWADIVTGRSLTPDRSRRQDP